MPTFRNVNKVSLALLTKLKVDMHVRRTHTLQLLLSYQTLLNLIVHAPPPLYSWVLPNIGSLRTPKWQGLLQVQVQKPGPH